jgi:hypothetical protein
MRRGRGSRVLPGGEGARSRSSRRCYTDRRSRRGHGEDRNGWRRFSCLKLDDEGFFFRRVSRASVVQSCLSFNDSIFPDAEEFCGSEGANAGRNSRGSSSA